MFRSSFGSCRTRNVSDVIGQPVFIAENHEDTDFIEPLSPKVNIFPSICKPKLFEHIVMQENECGSVTKDVFRRKKVSDSGVYFIPGEKEGRTCPPASPTSPLNTLFKLHEKEMKERKVKAKKAHQKSKKKKRERCRLSSSEEESNNNGWFSSENETEKFFSSKSFSSNSSESRWRRNKRSTERRRRAKNKRNSEMGVCPFVTKGSDKVEAESVAVVKRSSDPYSDFRTSMVEMIVEKQIFSTKGLEKLLQCFLSLNSPHHHRIIVEVFTEIWEALFSLT
ncbi:hypothetical protein IFM89_017273 [Coptis chinensis]|uniref:Transcription repressor n=1 Tax=Coptis chinensis TaxID=261450 RepID=A0A835IEH5_9MAGN|nr:hypothetical protein IFM89_017273 [Coptis chinensis]